MELALHADALPPATPIEESIRVAALCGFPWLLFALDALDAFFAHPDFDIRDLRRLFLRTQPAAAGTLALPDGDPAHHALVERHCRAVRRVGAPVLVLRLAAPDERVAALADIAARWGVVLALAPDEAGGAPTTAALRALVERLDHPALGLYLDTRALWRAGEHFLPGDAARTVLLAVGDLDGAGRDVLPGIGVIPLAAQLAPLREGGYNSLALLAGAGAASAEPLQRAREGRAALAAVLRAAGWEIAEWRVDE